jgi:A/G-specific adenine glycosylase
MVKKVHNLRPARPEHLFETAYRQEGLSRRSVGLFRRMIYGYYLKEGRSLPWRKTKNPYRILVSEVMLQQTPVARVLEKYRHFIEAFPDFPSLARAPLADVLGAWRGLGYNRRAVALKKTAEAVVADFGGRLPRSPEALVTLPGIGRYSAAAIYTFTTGSPSLFIETNIRRVYIHFFFRDRQGVSDDEIVPLLAKTLDRKDPRSWYYAVMDYGVKLKTEVENPNRRSARYRKQSPFEGSARQARGLILRTLTDARGMTKGGLEKQIPGHAAGIERLLRDLVKEGFLEKRGRRFAIRSGK